MNAPLEACLRTRAQGGLFKRGIVTGRLLASGDGDTGMVRRPVSKRI